MAVLVQVDGKNFNDNTLGEFCANSWDEATQTDLIFCY